MAPTSSWGSGPLVCVPSMRDTLVLVGGHHGTMWYGGGWQGRYRADAIIPMCGTPLGTSVSHVGDATGTLGIPWPQAGDAMDTPRGHPCPRLGVLAPGRGLHGGHRGPNGLSWCCGAALRGWPAWGPSGDILTLGWVCRGDTLTLYWGHHRDALSLGGGHHGTGVTPWLTDASPSPQSKAH